MTLALAVGLPRLSGGCAFLVTLRIKAAPIANTIMVMEQHYSFTSLRTKKRKNEDELQKTLKRCNSSSSNHFTSSQSSYSCENGRQWSYSDCDSSAFTSRDKFVIVSYNILGVRNASMHPDLYFKVPFKYMKWDHRRVVICKELAQYDPSIICFQEVDRFSNLHYALKQYGFQGIVKARTGDACDGCAIFWKREQFKLLHEDYIEFQSYGMRNNVAQFCVLKMNDDRLNSDPKMSKSKCLVVGNIHVLFNPNRGDVKLGQIRLFLEKAQRLSEEWGRIPVVLAGDFNSVPQSAVYQYISTAKLDIIQHDRQKVSGQIQKPQYKSCVMKEPFSYWNRPQKQRKYRWNVKEIKIATGNEKVTCLQHNLKLRSAYPGVPGNFTTRDNNGEPLATSYHSRSFETVDYIWHSEQLLPVRVLETLSRNKLENMGGLPNKVLGSDHLALACEFAFDNSEHIKSCSKRSCN